MTIVNSIEEMTADWFNEVLAESLGSARVASATTEMFGGGAFAQMVRATLTYDGTTALPPTMIVKFPRSPSWKLKKKGVALVVSKTVTASPQ